MNKDQLFSKKGLLSRNLKNYESRPQQSTMFQAVDKAITKSHHLMIEAGTGVGKTFAYLIPAIKQSIKTEKPVIISTHTINLQEQLFHKDIPFLKSALNIDFDSVLVKGRRNYICLRRLSRATNFQTDFFNTSLEIEEFTRLKQWINDSNEGSLSDISWTPSENVWSAVCCESDNCPGKKCSYYRQCFYRKSRSAVWKANIIVVNHALLLLDALLRQEENNILPNYEIIIIDEAHRLESIAQGHLGLEITNSRITHLLNSIHNPRTNKGLLSFIPPRISHLKECKKTLVAARQSADEFFNNSLEWLSNDAPKNGRIKEKSFVNNPLSPALSRLHFELKELKESLRRKKYKTPGKKWDETELSAFINRTASAALELDTFLDQSAKDYVYWMESRKTRFTKPYILLKSAPIDVSGHLNKLIFDQAKSAILTSATLATSSKDGLNYLKTVLGIKNAQEVMLGSSFDYSKQVKIYLTRDMPDPNDKESFVPMASERILKYLNLSKGNAFILFTNYDLMNRIYDRLYPELEKQGMVSYLQGKNLPRHKMIEEFKIQAGSIIFGADSFWQGVDVPGAALENIIITKLPFPVPTEPITEAKIEKMERNGIDSFMNYFIPEAIIKLRQGFGRLIRTKKDKGIVVILDNRLVTKKYGRFFIQSLPKCQTVIE